MSSEFGGASMCAGVGCSLLLMGVQVFDSVVESSQATGESVEIAELVIRAGLGIPSGLVHLLLHVKMGNEQTLLTVPDLFHLLQHLLEAVFSVRRVELTHQLVQFALDALQRFHVTREGVAIAVSRRRGLRMCMVRIHYTD